MSYGYLAFRILFLTSKRQYGKSARAVRGELLHSPADPISELAMSNVNELPTAGLIRRLLALVYDTLLLLGVTFAYGVVIWIIRKAAGSDMNSPPHPISEVAILLGLWITLAGYYVLCWTKRGQTLGMKSWRLLIVDGSGHYPTMRQSILRCLLAPVSAAPMALGYIWSWIDRRHGAWHDRWTGTRVVVLPKVRKQPLGSAPQQQHADEDRDDDRDQNSPQG